MYVTATTRHIVVTFSDVQPEGRDSFRTQFMHRYQEEGQLKKILRNMHASLNLLNNVYVETDVVHCAWIYSVLESSHLIVG